LTAQSAQGPVIVGAHSSTTIQAPLGQAVAVIDVGDLRMKPYSTLTLVGNAATQQMIIRVKGSKGMRISGRSTIALQGVQPEQVVFLISHRVYLLDEKRLLYKYRRLYQ
jgi:hypothetical protein